MREMREREKEFKNYSLAAVFDSTPLCVLCKEFRRLFLQSCQIWYSISVVALFSSLIIHFSKAMNDEASCYVGGLANEVTENVVEELFIQVCMFCFKKIIFHFR